MARKTPSRIQLRKEVEAAETAKKTASADGTTKKKAVRKKKATTTRRTKEKVPQRKKLVWGVFSGSMKEEARFPYDELDAAEQKADQLRSKSKKLYFIQPIKEPIADEPEEGAATGKTTKAAKAKKAKAKA